MTDEAIDSRWQCRKCGSLHVQVAMPAWYRQTMAGAMTYVDTDELAYPVYWYCETCQESDEGQPIDRTRV